MRDRQGVTVLEVLRRKQGLSQADVALAVGVSQLRISEIERGLRPSAEQLTALRNLFGMPASLENLLLESVEPLPPEVPSPPNLTERIRAMRARRTTHMRRAPSPAEARIVFLSILTRIVFLSILKLAPL